MEKGNDAGKKVSGIKRHIAVDTQGLPHALAVTTADVTDRKGCLLALERGRDNLGAVQKLLADGGYTQGLPHALAVTTADITDRKGCLLALKRELDNLGAKKSLLTVVTRARHSLRRYKR